MALLGREESLVQEGTIQEEAGKACHRIWDRGQGHRDLPMVHQGPEGRRAAAAGKVIVG